ncbi:hypothetical protein MPTK2_1g19130 [Marchantia polymorpha subsp. ruderalis]
MAGSSAFDRPGGRCTWSRSLPATSSRAPSSSIGIWQHLSHLLPRPHLVLYDRGHELVVLLPRVDSFVRHSMRQGRGQIVQTHQVFAGISWQFIEGIWHCFQPRESRMVILTADISSYCHCIPPPVSN